MSTVHETIIINATREQIRPIFFDPALLLEREKPVYRYEPDPDWPRVGAKFEGSFKTFLMDVHDVATCLAYDPDTLRLKYETVSEQSAQPGRWLYTFDEQDGQTTVSVTIDYYLADTWLGKALDRLLVERKNKEQVSASLAALKQQVEAMIADAA